jgi:hypothetical protein
MRVFIAMNEEEDPTLGVKAGSGAATRCFTSLNYAMMHNPRSTIAEFSVKDDDQRVNEPNFRQTKQSMAHPGSVVMTPSNRLELSGDLQPEELYKVHASGKEQLHNPVKLADKFPLDQVNAMRNHFQDVKRTAERVKGDLVRLLERSCLDDELYGIVHGCAPSMRAIMKAKVSGVNPPRPRREDEVETIRTLGFMAEACQGIAENLEVIRCASLTDAIDIAQRELNLARHDLTKGMEGFILGERRTLADFGYSAETRIGMMDSGRGAFASMANTLDDLAEAAGELTPGQLVMRRRFARLDSQRDLEVESRNLAKTFFQEQMDYIKTHGERMPQREAQMPPAYVQDHFPLPLEEDSEYSANFESTMWTGGQQA